MKVLELAGLAALLLTAFACLALPHRSLLFGERRCPRCGPRASMDRRHRSSGDRLVGLLVASRRYECRTCAWQGLIRDKAARRSGESLGTSEHEIQVFGESAATRRARS